MHSSGVKRFKELSDYVLYKMKSAKMRRMMQYIAEARSCLGVSDA